MVRMVTELRKFELALGELIDAFLLRGVPPSAIAALLASKASEDHAQRLAELLRPVDDQWCPDRVPAVSAGDSRRTPS